LAVSTGSTVSSTSTGLSSSVTKPSSNPQKRRTSSPRFSR
jgi:hypothetical protein